MSIMHEHDKKIKKIVQRKIYRIYLNNYESNKVFFSCSEFNLNVSYKCSLSCSRVVRALLRSGERVKILAK